MTVSSEQKPGRTKTREWLIERAEKCMFYIVVQLSLQNIPTFFRS